MSARLPDGAQLLLDAAHWIAISSPYLAAIAAAGLITCITLWRRRATAVRDALTGRVRFEVVPTNTFHPSENEVGRWTRHLGRATYAAGDVPSRGAAARLRYSARNGRMRCYLEGPERASAVLSLPGFAEVEVRAGTARSEIRPVRFPQSSPAQSDRP
ncbi:hypothetical protein ACWD4T_00530 [Streptomyces umbrinus]